MDREKKLKNFLLLFMSFIIILGTNPLNANAEQAMPEELKILAIEINPYLVTKGMKVTDYLNSIDRGNQNFRKSLEELKDDLNIASNGMIPGVQTYASYGAEQNLRRDEAVTFLQRFLKAIVQPLWEKKQKYPGVK